MGQWLTAPKDSFTSGIAAVGFDAFQHVEFTGIAMRTDCPMSNRAVAALKIPENRKCHNLIYINVGYFGSHYNARPKEKRLYSSGRVNIDHVAGKCATTTA